MIEHTCITADRVPIVVGLRVLDYDRRPSTVTAPPPDYDGPCDGRGWSAWTPGARGCWWTVTRDDDGKRGSFDGSRMTTRGATPEPRRHGTTCLCDGPSYCPSDGSDADNLRPEQP